MPKASRGGRKTRAKRPTSKRLSVRAFARLLGVSHTAVLKAIHSGRLSKSTGKDARGVFIADAKLARREWRENASKPTAPSTQDTSADGAVALESLTISEAERLVKIQRERKLRLENDVRDGRLYEVSRARRESFETARTVRDSLLNIPDRIASELAAEADPVKIHARLDAEIRGALIALADALDAEPDGVRDGGDDGR